MNEEYIRRIKFMRRAIRLLDEHNMVWDRVEVDTTINLLNEEIERLKREAKEEPTIREEIKNKFTEKELEYNDEKIDNFLNYCRNFYQMYTYRDSKELISLKINLAFEEWVKYEIL